ncbi:MAG: hypothetical protein AB1489_42660, partial [Acidobacteriota bacterium]
KWYLRSQSLSEGMHCSIQTAEVPAKLSRLATVTTSAPVRTHRQVRSSRTSGLRKRLRSLFYSILY